ncbi:22707_t:CDS:2, partial [Rhizophagus irregularis]
TIICKNNLNGTHRYGSVDYLVKFNNIAVLVNKIKMENILKGIVQAIMQLYSIKELAFYPLDQIHSKPQELYRRYAECERC